LFYFLISVSFLCFFFLIVLLIKTREKLEAMEVRLAALEAEQAADD